MGSFPETCNDPFILRSKLRIFLRIGSEHPGVPSLAYSDNQWYDISL